MKKAEPVLQDELLTVKDVAEILCISVRSVWRFSAAKQIPKPVMLSPRCARWKVSDIQTYLDNLKTAG